MVQRPELRLAAAVQQPVELRLAAAELRLAAGVQRPVELHRAAAELGRAELAVARRSAKDPPTVKETRASPESVRAWRSRR